MKIVIIGKRGWGKTTLFKFLSTGFNYQEKPGGVKISKIFLPDERLNSLVNLLHPPAHRYPEIELIDAGADLNLSSPYVMDADLLLISFKFFSPIASESDLDTLWEIFLERDTSIINKRLESLEIEIRKKHEEDLKKQQEVLLKAKDYLEKKIFLGKVSLSPVEKKLLMGFSLLTLKKILFVFNYDENFNQQQYKKLVEKLQSLKVPFAKIASRLEIELLSLKEEERKSYREAFGIDANDKTTLFQKVLEATDLITFYTIAGKEVRAWLIEEGSPIIKAAGKIHSDMERGFIKAEVISFPDFINCKGSLAEARSKGLLKIEGKEYLIKDGDIVYIKFKV